MSKLIVSTPESGDWTVVQDDQGRVIYSGHDAFSQLVQVVLGWANDQVEVDYIEWEDEEFQSKF